MEGHASATSDHDFFSDEPQRIISADDPLDRLRVVERIQNVLAHLHDQEGSAVVGLVAPWGAGKTTILNHLESHTVGWQVHRLETWLASDAGELATELYSTIVGALPREGEWNDVRESAARFFQAATPWVGLVHRGAADFSSAMAQRYGAQRSLTQQHAELEESLRGLEEPILVLIDDVDRLQPIELRELLRALRVVGRLPRVMYLLAYDERSLLDALRMGSVAITEERARDFLEKIVQVRIDIPPLLPDQAHALILDALGRVNEEVAVDLTEGQLDRLNHRWNLALHLLVSSPRHIRLVEGQLLATWGDVSGEVDVVDFISITIIRLLQPRLYLSLAENRHLLTGKESLLNLFRYAADRDGLKSDRAALRSCLTGELSWHLQNGMGLLLNEMFPLLRDGSVDVANGIGSPAYVDRYFYTGIPSDDISDRLIAEGVRSIADGVGGTARTLVEAKLLEPDLRARLIMKLSLQSQRVETAGQVNLLRWALTTASEGENDTLELTGWVIALMRNPELTAEGVTSVLRDASDSGLDAVMFALAPDLGVDEPQGHSEGEAHGLKAVEALIVEVRQRLSELLRRPPESDTPFRVRTALEFTKRFAGEALDEIFTSVDQPGGWDLLDVAARFVTRTSSDGRTWRAGEFDEGDFVRIVPERQVSAAKTLAASAPRHALTSSPDHENLRQIATQALSPEPRALPRR